MAPHPHPRSGAPGRRAFTAIELLVVLSVSAILAAIGAGTLLPALRHAAVNESVAAIEEACRLAHAAARKDRDPDASERYGVVLWQEGERWHVAVSHAARPDRGALAELAGGVYQRPLARGIGIAHDGGAAGPIGWLYRPGSGFVTASAVGSLRPAVVGQEAADLQVLGLDPADYRLLLPGLRVETLDGRIGYRIQVLAGGSVLAEAR